MRELLQGPVVLLDGALATELERQGHDLDHPLWSARCLLEAPDAIAEVHRSYVAAGADVLTTATYQATAAGFRRVGFLDDPEPLFRRAAAIARAAAEEVERRVTVAGSVGSYGAFLADGSEYRGDYGRSVDELVAFHRPRLETIARHVDVIACETVPCLVEAQALGCCLRGLERPAWVSFSCRDAEHVVHGERLVDCAAALAEVEEVFAVGVNCTAPRHVEGAIRALRGESDRAVVVYPNSGEDYDGRWCGEATSPLAFADLAERWHAAGAQLIGGCCRTGPAHVAAMRARWPSAD